jgi:hypothetical protein
MEAGKRRRSAENSPLAKRASSSGTSEERGGDPPECAVSASPSSPTGPAAEEAAPQTAAPSRASDGLGPVRPEFALPPDLALPRFAVYEIMTRVLPPGAGVECEALDAVAAAGVRFTALLASRAREFADGRPSRGGEPTPRPVKGQHASVAAAQLGFPGIARVLAAMQAPVADASAADVKPLVGALEKMAEGGRKRKR